MNTCFRSGLTLPSILEFVVFPLFPRDGAGQPSPVARAAELLGPLGSGTHERRASARRWCTQEPWPEGQGSMGHSMPGCLGGIWDPPGPGQGPGPARALSERPWAGSDRGAGPPGGSLGWAGPHPRPVLVAATEPRPNSSSRCSSSRVWARRYTPLAPFERLRAGLKPSPTSF